MSKELDKKRCGANVEKVIVDEFVPSKAIDNANPSEALKCVDKLEQVIEEITISNADLRNTLKASVSLAIIKQSLLKAQEQEKVLEILKNKKVDIWKFIDNGIFNYSYDDYYFCWNYYSCEKLTQEEFDLLKRWQNDK